ncbi:MAG: phage GP46 family protein [Treponema sp.]|jgi:phage gp46-like protein|nr:phage GP46 family protein [Treponema sp.]
MIGTTVKIEHWADVQELTRMSIGTDKGSWWADPAFGSEIWKLRQAGKIDNRTAGTFQRMLQDCLTWLTDDGIAGGVVCTAERSGKHEIAYSVTVSRPDTEPLIIKDVWNALR